MTHLTHGTMRVSLGSGETRPIEAFPIDRRKKPGSEVAVQVV